MRGYKRIKGEGISETFQEDIKDIKPNYYGLNICVTPLNNLWKSSNDGSE